MACGSPHEALDTVPTLSVLYVFEQPMTLYGTDVVVGLLTGES